uniref:Uncharacterized protein n=1 Tax=Oryza nivara TaxID=4536 RepID=A0A0E0JBV8_ORYNI
MCQIFQVSYKLREGNRVAHRLADLGSFVPDLALPPPELTGVYAAAGRWEAEVRRWRPEAAGPAPGHVDWGWLEVVGRVVESGKTLVMESL